MTKSVEKKNSINELIDEGVELYNKGNYIEAVRLYKTALMMSKKHTSLELAGLYVRLANCYYKLADNDKAAEYYELYLKEYPQGQASVFSRLALYYYYLDVEKSIDYYNKSLNIDVNIYDTVYKLFNMTKSNCYSQQHIKEESEFEASNIKNNLFQNIKKYTHDDKKNDHKLNIAYLSGDCHTHTMMNYIIPIWRNHNQEEFNFYLFNFSSKDDATTQRIRDIGFEVIDCKDIKIEDLAKKIYDKKIDILVDISGHTHSLSYVAFYKPAPIMIQYLGYLNTLGIKEVDYILADRFTIPESTACLYTEKPLYLDTGYQIFDKKDVPPLEESPFKKNGYVTFGCYNCSSKINDANIFMWSKILEQVPDSKLMIYRTQLTKKMIKNLQVKFENRGISEDRVIFTNKKYSPHYKAYFLSDINLDTYPFSGMSIAIETALMGVPTITLSGDNEVGMQSKGAGRINKVLGLEELNASYGEEYVQAAVKLANDREKLEDLRKNLRDRINNSSLVSGAEEFTRDLESKYKKAWNEYLNS